MIIEIEINGARLIVSGDNLSISVTEETGEPRHITPHVGRCSGRALERYLSENQIKPSAFAAEIGVAPSTITRLIKGERSPRLDLIMLIKEKTGGQVTADDFFEAAA